VLTGWLTLQSPKIGYALLLKVLQPVLELGEPVLIDQSETIHLDSNGIETFRWTTLFHSKLEISSWPRVTLVASLACHEVICATARLHTLYSYLMDCLVSPSIQSRLIDFFTWLVSFGLHHGY